MSGHLRFSLAGLVIVGGLSVTPASATPFAEFFNNALREPAAISSAQAECQPQPQNSTGEGQHWVYRRAGNRKCWFLAEGIATLRKAVHRRFANRTASPDESESARRRRSPDDRTELLRSAPVERIQPTPPAREVKIAEAASIFGTGMTALTPATPLANLPISELTPDRPVPRPVQLEKLLGAAPAASEAATVPPVVPLDLRAREADDEGRAWTETWIGVLLMALGIVSVLSSSRVLREAVLSRH
ncbi:MULTISPECIES: hypothetical protein [unclassified Bradyrhizobium]|uniref:Uncharacterized protein n=1 Tax=Bradyrhizobium sp. LLZ17 TaxID=3239388 RepID=A0AB39XI79_9BRAD